MANTPPSPDLSQQTDEELIATLRSTKRHRELEAQVIAELRRRDKSLNKIAELADMNRATVQDRYRRAGETE